MCLMKQLKVKPFAGDHCETTATGTILNSLGIELSEPLLFGIGEGLGYIFWNMKNMEFPFIGGRIKPDLLTLNIASNLKLDLCIKETTSQQKAWDDVRKKLDEGKIVGLKLDSYHLDYFTNPIHFAGHYVAIYGYDEKEAYLVDTIQQGTTVKTSLDSLAKARCEKGAMSSKNLFYTIKKKRVRGSLEDAILQAIRNNVRTYLDPPISNISFKGIERTSREVKKWFERSKNISYEFSTIGHLMENGGTGGALFRNMYRDFLKEAYDILQKELLLEASVSFAEIASMWNQVSQLFVSISETKDAESLRELSQLFKCISAKEKAVMEKLLRI